MTSSTSRRSALARADATSSALNARRASPLECSATCVRNPSLAVNAPASPRSLSSSARSSSTRRSASSSERRAKTRQRDRSAEFTSNEGFSVVAPISVMIPRSTCGSRASCCALLKRWISSMKSSVLCRVSSSRRSACATDSRMSLMPLSTAERATSSARVAAAITRASVVFPVPGGPQKISDGTWSVAIASRSKVFGPRMCCCPTTSSTVRGRIRSGNGTSDGSRAAAARKRSPVFLLGMYVGIGTQV